MFSFLKASRMPHVFVIIGSVIFVCSLLTHVVPSGEYQRETREINQSKRTIVVPNTYQKLEKNHSTEGLIFAQPEKEGMANPTSLHEFLMAVPAGMEKSADIIFFIFLIGGVFGILTRTGVITGTVYYLLELFDGKDKVLIILIMLTLAIGGSTLGMGEEFIPLVPIFLLVAQRMGYDRIVGLGMVIMAAQVGFASATTNPFTVGVAQGVAGIPLYSGTTFRVIFFAISFVITVGYLLWYGDRIKRDPSRSLVPNDGIDHDIEKVVFTGRHVAVLITSVVLFCGILWATQSMHWWMTEMSGGFLLMGILAAIIGGLNIHDSAEAFVKGMGEMVVAALVVGFARGIEVVLTQAKILDTLVFHAANFLGEVPRYVAVQGMFLFQSMLNFLIPSGSGQAAVTMPLMTPLADVLGITRQTAVFAFQCGDGFSNLLIPTSGILMAMLALARIPYTQWLRFIVPLFLFLSLNGMIFLVIAVATNYT